MNDAGGKETAERLIRAAIFDLDDTLYDCLHQRVEVAHRHAAEAMVKAGVNASVDEVLAARMKACLTDPQLKYIDAEVGRAFHVADMEAASRAARDAYFSCPVGKLTLFPDSLKVLRGLRERGVRNFVVSFGDLETQQAKVKSLGLDKEDSVENIFYAERGKNVTKESIFRYIVEASGIPGKNFLVVGDRVASEIAAGNHLGMHTVRMQGGEFALLHPQKPEEFPQFEISQIGDLLILPFTFATGRA